MSVQKCLVVLLGLVLSFGCIGHLDAAQIVLDFDSITTPLNGFGDMGDTVTEDGYTLSTESPNGPFYACAEGWISGRGSSNGTTTLSTYWDLSKETIFDLESSGGNAFSIVSIDLAEFVNSSDPDWDLLNAHYVEIAGSKAGGSTVNETFTLDMISDGSGGVEDFQTFVFPSAWDDLSSVQFTARNPDGSFTYIAFDNIILESSAVPEPSTLAVWSLLALCGIGIARYRRRKA